MRYKPVADLGIIPVTGAETISENINKNLQAWRKYGDYIVGCDIPRFQSGEGKAHILRSIRGKDLYIIVDVMNHSIKYDMFGEPTRMSPDDHYQDLKRVISAVGGKAHKITVIMPFLYEGRQHKRSSRESLDCSVMLRELENMGVDTIITFDAHDPRVQNAICLLNFENVSPMNQFVETLVEKTDIEIDSSKLMVVSPDEGATQRGIFLSSVLGVQLGMFYKRRDFTKVVNGKNPILAHEFLGDNVEGKDILIVDDMIASGDSVIDVAKQLKSRGANRIIAMATFGLFSSGFEAFDAAYKDGTIYRVMSTDLIYQRPELADREWFENVPMSEYIAALIDNLNCDNSISDLINPAKKIQDHIQEIKKS